MNAGFVEISHTADWALRVWAPDLSTLFYQAAVGMYSLMGVVSGSSAGDLQIISLEAGDDECLLVNFLSELLYFLEEEWIGFSTLAVKVENNKLTATGTFGKIQSLQKEIKAVTFHNLAIQKKEGLYEVTIVFDV